MSNETKIKIVLADDEKFIARAYTEGLTRAGFEVTSCPDGLDALEQVKKIRPDIVLLDLIMPGMTGFEVLKAMKEDPTLKDIPVLILSNLSQATDQDEAKSLGAEEFVIKSEVSLEEVVNKVKSFFNRTA
jgi:PleD family two-component response regulator